MIFRSPHAPITIPDISLPDYVLATAEKHGDKPALIDGPSGRVITYAQLRPMIRRLAAGFSSYGVKQNDVVAILSPNLPEYVLAFHAIASLGAITTMVPPLFTDEEIGRQLRDSGARYLLTIPPLIARASEAGRGSNVSTTFVIGEAQNAVSFASLLNTTEDAPPVRIEPNADLAALPYSSGTTGFPKGVMLSHRNLVAMLCQLNANEPLTEKDTMICVVPMYHLYGLHVVANLALCNGATVVTVPRYDEQEFFHLLARYQVTVAPLVPPIVLTLSRAANLHEFDLSHLRLIHCGAASLSDDIARACSKRLKCEIRYGYGLTEVSPLSHATLAGQTQQKAGSVGYCLPNTECKIVDYKNQAELGPYQEGEIWVRGPQVMRGYWGNPEATREMIDSEGWLRTGDIGYADVDGELFVVDRLKELIKYKGRQVAPAELEALLITHPAVADAAVLPSPDESAGEVPKAFVVLRDKASPEELMEFVAARVAPHKKIRLVEFVSAIPRSPAGKILRRLLREQDS